jgi:signal transduction histidine kinase
VATKSEVEVFVGGGEMGQLIRAKDWSQTAIGPLESWSPTLKTMVRFLLANRFPLLLWWGKDYVSIYNDAYRPVLGAKHPWALGTKVSECWSEIWHVLKPLIDTPFQGGPSTWNEDIELEVNRHGFLEETHFTVAYSPVPDDTEPSGIGGVLATVNEITEKVVAERRVIVLRDLGAHAGQAQTAEEACAFAARTLEAHAKDVPFALFYPRNEDGERVRLAAVAGVPNVARLGDVDRSASAWPLEEALRTPELLLVQGLAERFAVPPPGPWSDPPTSAVVMSIPSHQSNVPAGVMVLGVSARLAFDARYRDFFELLRAQVAAAIAQARALEQERKRVEALAALDRAKTAFFSNVSHEFRTPLTLMLGPIEDELAAAEPLSAERRERLELVRRNGLRLQKLVNTLLDFARIEAGRAQASYAPTRLGELTAELASVFRSAIEKAGLRLIVDCPPLAEPAYVDRDMWEKIVLNLVSNAFKFTLEGEIRVSLRQLGERIELAVSDTGVGIRRDQLARIFERFYRVKNDRSRTHEGTGIGLSLVRELVRQHGGEVDVESEENRGTTFRVRLPTGSAHLPAAHLVDERAFEGPSSGAAPFLAEALRWFSAEGDGAVTAEPDPSVRARGETSGGRRPRVLLADDNADMRAYVQGLLSSTYEVTALSDGHAALASIRESLPDLVLTDVMMPKIDGFGLVAALRSEERTRTLPIIMLSARAGEEAHIEGLSVGVNDYIVKPFSARELLARVGAQLEIARVRSETEAALRQADRSKDEFLATLAHELRNPLAPLRNGLELLRLSGADAGTRTRLHDVMARQVGHMVRLVDDLLEVSRITRGKVELRKEEVELGAIARVAVETSRPWLEAAHHELELDLPSEPLLIHADPVRLSQILSNLLNNAAKYTPDGGKIRLSVRRDGAEVVASVRDNGIGIAAAMLPRVFDLFMQIEHGIARAHGGLGIGLTLVRSFVALHGGSVEARSEGSGRGSEFIVRLPLVAPKAGEGASDAGLERPGLAPRRILVVDDNRDAAETLGMLLELSGAHTRVVHDGQAALEAFRSYRPAVVLLDLGLPGMDGYEIARRLRDEPGGVHAKLIALTGWGQEEDRRRSRAAGIDHHLVKPVDMRALEAALEAERQA